MNVPTLETRAVLRHAHSELMTRDDLWRLTCAPATETFRPIPHYELVTALVETLLKRKLQVRREEYAVQRRATWLFGVLDWPLGAERVRLRYRAADGQRPKPFAPPVSVAQYIALP